MLDSKVETIIREELRAAEERILRRIESAEEPPTEKREGPDQTLPDNPNYRIALSAYLRGETHSGLSRTLGVSINAVKKYYNWLVKHGYLPAEEAALSEMEEKVVECIFERKMSLRETAKLFGCSVSNISYRRDSALRKGYVPPED